MQVISYMRAGSELAPIEVEISLMPGLPIISFLGLPDAAIKESVLRVKSALREQGFVTPRAHQTLVHLRPSHLRKSSRGLDLAVAAGILWETGQLPRPSGSTPFVYGELSLKGEILRPDDLDGADAIGEAPPVLTGPGAPHPSLTTLIAHDLRGLSNPLRVAPGTSVWNPVRPTPACSAWPAAAAHLLAVVAAGEHPAVIAGPPGTGKTTLAEAVASFMVAPTFDEHRSACKWAKGCGADKPTWRQRVQPHHSITPLAMIGGGSPLRPGEITRAHGGVLILDELLEFAPEVQEALREPLESGVISLARGGAARTFPARFAMVATTNLCRCGYHDPFAEVTRCSCSRTRRAQYLSRLSGPFLDRAQILAFSADWRQSCTRDESVASAQILAMVATAHDMRRARLQRAPNAYAPLALLTDRLDAFEREQILRRPLGSARRSAAIVRTARTLADIDGSFDIKSAHWAQAMRWSACSFERLQAAGA